MIFTTVRSSLSLKSWLAGTIVLPNVARGVGSVDF